MRLFAFTSSALPVVALQILVLSSDHAFGAVIPIERRMFIANDLKTSTYRKEALKHNNGAYVPNASNTGVKWKIGANGQVEHVVEPGAQVKDALNKSGVKKGSDFHKELKKVLNHPDNLSVLHSGANIAKAKLAVNPNGNPKNKATAMDYIQQQAIKDKATKTMAKIESTAEKYKIKGFAAQVKANVKKIFPHIKRSGLDKYYLD